MVPVERVGLGVYTLVSFTLVSFTSAIILSVFNSLTFRCLVRLESQGVEASGPSFRRYDQSHAACGSLSWHVMA